MKQKRCIFHNIRRVNNLFPLNAIKSNSSPNSSGTFSHQLNITHSRFTLLFLYARIYSRFSECLRNIHSKKFGVKFNTFLSQMVRSNTKILLTCRKNSTGIFARTLRSRLVHTYLSFPYFPAVLFPRPVCLRSPRDDISTVVVIIPVSAPSTRNVSLASLRLAGYESESFSFGGVSCRDASRRFLYRFLLVNLHSSFVRRFHGGSKLISGYRAASVICHGARRGR